jgi:glycogen synthase
MRSHDVFLFPSIYEGLGITLIEAMAAGCVPVASRIRGVTDFIIDDGYDGLLFDVGDAGRAAQHLRRLCNDRELLAQLRLAGELRARDFDLSKFGDSYVQLLKRVEDTPRPIKLPLPISSWSLPPGLAPGFRRFLPAGVKGYLRIARERVRGFGVRF